ncbi:Uncharacterised protein [BD1-7 clade bacterium]|uniref:GST N-terminal domain-containing protein n=1 Tax=BD1-7 clade bacterium TaxID=2029982 RepID=A0A5S9PAS9_9GAMM|nr:Uncharacterised protein [BD1-7 clade bacterium]CAA0116562.1 Uncharacterised protein [BD1-7 clade bacterium]
MPTTENLALYHYNACPFCAMTRQALKHFKLNVEQRDIQRHRPHRQQLVKGGGRAQVPCLRIEHDNGRVEWLYESRDIIDYLRDVSRAAA